MSQNISNIAELPQKKNDVTKWCINGHEFRIDLRDADTIEMYENAFGVLGEEEKALPKDGKSSVRVRAYCAMFRRLFNTLFGEGTDEKLFGSRNNSDEVTSVYSDFLEFVTRQRLDTAEKQAQIINRYSPNRAQRRAAAKK